MTAKEHTELVDIAVQKAVAEIEENRDMWRDRAQTVKYDLTSKAKEFERLKEARDKNNETIQAQRERMVLLNKKFDLKSL